MFRTCPRARPTSLPPLLLRTWPALPLPLVVRTWPRLPPPISTALADPSNGTETIRAPEVAGFNARAGVDISAAVSAVGQAPPAVASVVAPPCTRDGVR